MPLANPAGSRAHSSMCPPKTAWHLHCLVAKPSDLTAVPEPLPCLLRFLAKIPISAERNQIIPSNQNLYLKLERTTGV